jgi:hypothetical protein
MKGFRVGRVISWKSPGTSIPRNVAQAKAARRTPATATRRGRIRGKVKKTV